jgi:hypothetical protein
MNGQKKNMYRLPVGKPERKRLLGRPRHRCMNSIMMDQGGVDLIGLAQDKENWRALVNVVMNLHRPQKVGKFSNAQLMASQVVLSSIQLLT